MATFDSALGPVAATVDGDDLEAEGAFDVINPATGEVFARAPAVTGAQLDTVFAAAQRAQEGWRADDGARRDALSAAADRLEAAGESLVTILTAEQGKPLADSRREIDAAVHWLRYFADLQLPREILRDDDEGYEEIIRRPLGVVAAITPWNFPIGIAHMKIAPALRAGNAVVLKPSPYTPLTTLAVGQLMRDVFPPGVFNVVSGRDPLGADMVSHPVPRKISFTGSTATGKQVAAASAEDLKRVTLELGGNDPAIVLGDVDVDEIAPRLFFAGFRNNGQLCVAVKRVYAHESVHADLVEALGAIAAQVKVDEGTVEGAQLGPINNRAQFERVSALVTDALDRGGRAVFGGAPIDRSGYFFTPTVIDHVDDGFRVVDEEQFGPVLPVLAFRDEVDALARANRSHYGLTASIWTSDWSHAARLASGLESGQVTINAHSIGVRPDLPFGGLKWSGVGVENGPWGFYGFSEIQVVIAPPRSGG